MLSLGAFAFLQAWLLLALLLLPLLWWLLRVTPPAPKRVVFPPLRLLLGLQPREETPARTPPWLILLRIVAAALIVLGLARPVLNPGAELTGAGPVLLVVDNGWAAARDWQAREELLTALLQQAERSGRRVALLPTAPDPGAQPAAIALTGAGEVLQRLQELQPRPWETERGALAAALEDFAPGAASEAVWLSDGLAGDGDGALLAALRRLGSVRVYGEEPSSLPHLLQPPQGDGLDLELTVERAATGFEEKLTLQALDGDGRVVAQREVSFPPEARAAGGALRLPIELRNRIARIAIPGEASAGAVQLLDDRNRRRVVGLVSASPLEDAQPLLSDLFYLQRALEPFAEISRGEIGELLRRELSILALADVGGLAPSEAEALESWVRQGGLLLRFAGPRMAESAGDLLPVTLRSGGRTLGGALTWDEPARLAPFPEDSPFSGLPIPRDVTIERQVLAEPSLELGERTWARLSDGTPLVTAEAREQGWVVLIHTTANTDWSNLSLSGLFVSMLQRLVDVSQGIHQGDSGDAPLPPLATLDGFGQLGSPAAGTAALDPASLRDGAVGPRNPPGYYGADNGGRRVAFNLTEAVGELQPLTPPPGGLRPYGARGELDLSGWLLGGAVLLGLIDLLISLWLRGLAAPPGRLGRAQATAAAGAALLLLAMTLAAPPGAAQSTDDRFALESALETRLAYIETGVPAVDEVSRAGLEGLTRLLHRRTAAEPVSPVGVAPGEDELAFFPLLYWPIAPEQRDLDSAAVEALKDFIRGGGTILIDLREPGANLNLYGQPSRNTQALRRLTAELDLPPLKPLPVEHVLTKAFYLMQDFPGRYAGGDLWIEDTEETRNDGVASVIIGSNDWAGAWAINDVGQPRFAVLPGGERQREMAYRAGVNVVMYALTGNYKSDQVHIPFILERLGQ
ncbi:MAG: DUF4159 domain-containing protein [Rhodovibrionaceae bacterium]